MREHQDKIKRGEVYGVPVPVDVDVDVEQDLSLPSTVKSSLPSLRLKRIHSTTTRRLCYCCAWLDKQNTVFQNVPPHPYLQTDDEQNGVVLEELCNEFAPNYPYSSYSVNDENHSHRAGELTWSEYPCIVHPAAPQGHVTDDALGDGTLYCSLPHVPGGHQSPGPGRGRTPLQEGTGKPAWKSR